MSDGLDFKQILEAMRKGRLNDNDLPIEFARKVRYILESQKDIPQDIAQVIDDNFWEVV